MAPSPLPKFVYKIVPSAPPSPIPDEYPLSDLDKADGFVHLSTADQASCPFSSIDGSLRKGAVSSRDLHRIPGYNAKSAVFYNLAPHFYTKYLECRI